MRRVAYLHGVPGGPNELALFGGAPFAGCDLYVPDRTGAAPKDLDALAAAIGAHFAGQAFDLVGFSLGGFVALEVAARLGAQVARIDLVATAAPLESERDLATMAGAADAQRPLIENNVLGRQKHPLCALARTAGVGLSRQPELSSCCIACQGPCVKQVAHSAIGCSAGCSRS